MIEKKDVVNQCAKRVSVLTVDDWKRLGFGQQSFDKYERMLNFMDFNNRRKETVDNG